MRHLRTLSLAALALAATAAIPGAASASCNDRRVTGTVVGGLAGALLGNSVSRGGGGAVVGGLGGAVAGNVIAGRGCNDRYRTVYRSSGRSRSYARPAAAPAPKPVRYVYYDQYGNAISAGPAPQPVLQPASGAPPTYTQAAYQPGQTSYSGGYCRTENRAYYDERGALVYRPATVCTR